MEFRKYISKEAQEKWFEEVNDIKKCLYLLIQINGKSLGLTHVRNFVDNNTEAGIFIWDDEYIQSHYPVVVSNILCDLNFYFFGNNRAFGRMLKSNKEAIAYNSKFGLRLEAGQENVDNQLYVQSLKDYETAVPAIRNNLRILYKDADDTISILLEKEDDQNGIAEFMKEFYKSSVRKNLTVRFRLIHL